MTKKPRDGGAHKRERESKRAPSHRVPPGRVTHRILKQEKTVTWSYLLTHALTHTNTHKHTHTHTHTHTHAHTHHWFNTHSQPVGAQWTPVAAGGRAFVGPLPKQEA